MAVCCSGMWSVPGWLSSGLSQGLCACRGMGAGRCGHSDCGTTCVCRWCWGGGGVAFGSVVVDVVWSCGGCGLSQQRLVGVMFLGVVLGGVGVGYVLGPW